MEIDELLKNPSLWEHQVNCIAQCKEYINAYRHSRTDIGGALNRLPTGTGKSGIIAILSRCLVDTPRVLVLTPSIVLREQLLEDIEFDFFRTIGLDNNLFVKKIMKFLPQDVPTKISEFEENSSVFVTTIQSLYILFSENLEIFERLRKATDLVIFDEGHREPAPEWARAVRSISKPCILFTATPYRNDRKRFNINDSYVFALTHQDAAQKNYIRSTNFRVLNESARRTEVFVDLITEFYEKELPIIKPNKIETPRVIIHCNNFADIIEICNLISDKGYTVLGIHDRFKGKLRKGLLKGSATLKKNVPNLKQLRKRYIEKGDDEGLDKFNKNLPIFWVHQYKLLEGIDEFTFCVIANYSPMINARMMIQQVGRVLRNRNQEPGNSSIIISQTGSPDYKFWQGYQKYESKYEDTSIMEILYYQEMFDSVTNVLPEFHYEGKDFKTRFDWYKKEDLDGNLIDEDFSYHKHIKFKLSCNALKNNKKYTLDQIEIEIRREWYTKEFDLRFDNAEKPFDDMIVIPYIRIIDSPFLSDLYLFNFSFGYTVCRLTEDYLFYYDSNGSVSDFINEKYDHISPEILSKLFPNNDSTLQNITLRSTDIGNYIIRKQDLTAASLNNTVADLVDYLNFYSTAKGSSSDNQLHTAQRYVGFTKSRISDLTGTSINYEQYYNWINDLIGLLNDASIQGTTYFDRFAPFTTPPNEAIPLNILIDYDEVDGHFVYRQTKHDLRLDLTCQDIEKDIFKLSIEIDDKKFKKYYVKVIYNDKKRKYYLDCPELTKDFTYYDSNGQENKKENLIRYLNREQCFRIIPEANGLIYAHSQFYKPRLSVVNPQNVDSIELMTLFHPVDILRKIKSEKGERCTKKTWQANSLFRLIDDLGGTSELNNYLKDVDYLICDDTGDNEICDFVGLTLTPPKVIVIHCKAFAKERKRSATALQEVSSQAIKNLSYLVLNNTIAPPNSKFWNKSWSAAGVTGELQRLRYSERKFTNNLSTSPTIDLLNKFQGLIRNTSTRKEVYIVLGRGFRLDDFRKNILSSKPDSVNIQIAYLVQSTWSNIRKIASDFKIFCG